MTRATRRSRGYTLVELLVAVTVSTLVVAAGVALLLSQQAAFRSGSDDRALQETGRVALEDVAANLQMAGFGLDPGLAFDFGAMGGVIVDRAPGGVAVSVRAPADCGTPVTCRDQATGPDELVFRARNPAFMYRAVAVSGTQIQIQGPLRTPLSRGQVLQVMCMSGALEWAFVTVNAGLAAGGALQPTIDIGTGDPAAPAEFPRQNPWLARAGSCFQTGAVAVYKVDRFRYFIQRYATSGAVSSTGRPFLMLDQGLFDGDGLAIVTPVAADVEDLQVTYLFPRAQGTARAAVPPTPGTRLVNGAGGIHLAAGSPAYSSPRNDATRLNNHPANIRAVRVAIVARSAEPLPSVTDATVPAAGNRPATTSTDVGYRRLLFEATTATRNLDARTPYIPAYSTNSGADNLNIGGG